MKREVMKGNKFIQTYDSINEFYSYLCKTPFNNAFRWQEHSSTEQGPRKTRWTGTESFEQATDMLRNGWEDMAKQLQKQLQSKEVKMQPVMQQRNKLSVQGYQPVVPLYLAGVPQNMVSKKMVPVKQKVVNIVKVYNYSADISAQKIQDESIKVMQLVKKLERQGMKCNIYIALGSAAGGRQICCKVKIKSASERLNVSKLAFPLVHPSMLRRLLFRYIEVCPDVTSSYTDGYGRPIGHSDMKAMFPDDIVLPAIWETDVDNIRSIEDITGTI